MTVWASGKSKGTLAGLLAVLFWSMTAAAVVSAPGVDPFLYIGLEHAIGCGIFLLKWGWERHNPLPELRRVPLWFLGAGLIGITVHELTWVAALQQAPPMEATLIIYLWPLLVVIFTAIALKQSLYWYHWAGMGCGLTGVAVMLVGRGLSFAQLDLQSGHWIAVVCALSWSLYSAIAARQRHMSADALSVILLVSCLLNLGYWRLGLGAPPAPVRSLWVVCLSSVPIMVAYMLWDYAMKHGEQQLIGIASFMTPVLAAVGLVALDKTALTPHLIGALALVMLGIGCAKYGNRRERV